MHGNSNSPDAPRFMSGSWTRSMHRQKEEWCRWWKERAVTMVDNQIIFLSIIPFSSSAWLSLCLSAFPLLFCYLLISQAGEKTDSPFISFPFCWKATQLWKFMENVSSCHLCLVYHPILCILLQQLAPLFLQTSISCFDQLFSFAL